jgi:hypothetical protein
MTVEFASAAGALKRRGRLVLRQPPISKQLIERWRVARGNAGVKLADLQPGLRLFLCVLAG